MSRPHLYEYDLLLCDYVRGTIAGQLYGRRQVRPARRPARPIDAPKRGRRPPPDALEPYRGLPPADILADWLQDHLSYPELWSYLTVDKDLHPAFLLDHSELEDIAQALEGLGETGLAKPVLRWTPWEHAHHKYLDSMREICDQIAPATAQQFAEFSVRSGASLAADGVMLWDGVRIVDDWVREIRHLLRTLGHSNLLPRPEGQHPTPRFPETDLADNVRQAISDIRDAFKKTPPLATASKNAVHDQVGGNRNDCFVALDWLEARDEYRGAKRRRKHPPS